MKVKLILKNIAGSTDLDDISEQYVDTSILESLYEIRKLRAALLLGYDVIEVNEPNNYGQVFNVEHSVYFNRDEYEIVEWLV